MSNATEVSPELVYNAEFAAILIETMGGPTAVGRVFRIKPPSVIGWRRRGITAVRCDSIRLRAPNEWARAVEEWQLRQEYRRTAA